MARPHAALVAIAIAFACSPRVYSVGRFETGGSDTGSTSIVLPQESSSGGSLDGSSTTTSGSHTPKLDVGAATDSVGDEMGCQKADFLFVIDNSTSMEDEQDSLIASFNGFITTIEDTLMAQDYHILVVDTDASGGGGSTVTCTNGVCECEPVPACCETACENLGGISCNSIPCDMVPGSQCDATLGAGKVFRSDGTLCMHEEPRYMSVADDDLAETFACVGEVGTFGDGNEQPMAAMLLALGDVLRAPNGCNTGFLRDDAILVVTFITDEDDQFKSPGDPASWRDDLVAAKLGNEEAIVVLGLFGDTDQPDALCQPLDGEGTVGAQAGVRLRELTQSFGDHGVIGSVCAADYNPFFTEAVAIIDTACDEFVPPG
ncbi:MAG TPA: hypothetical protein VG755_26080 [Nannocystaceae bacterium]|nr:hypothetical protein [Nannocystaceae bacterium]